MANMTTIDILQGVKDWTTRKLNNNDAKNGYYVCSTDENVAAKTISATNYVLGNGGSIKVKMTNANTADNATLNINSTGAKALYYQGERASATNSWDAEEVVEIYYDGTSYYANNVNGGSGSGVYDVSKEHPTSGPNSDGKFTLEYILNSSNVNELIPVNKRYPGMTIQFVSTSDNMYVYYTYKGTATTGTPNPFLDVTNWEKVVLEEDLDNAVSKWYLNNDGGIGNKIREVYLEGLDITKQYYLSYQYGDKFYIWIMQKGDTNVVVASWYGTVTDGIIILTERNSSGVTGKVLVADLSISDTLLKNVDIDNSKAIDTYYSPTIHFSSEINSVKGDVHTNSENIQTNTNNISTLSTDLSILDAKEGNDIASVNRAISSVSDKCDDIIGKKDITYDFAATSPAYTLKYVNFNFVNGGIYKIKITYPTGVNTSTKFSVRGENGSGVVKDNIGTGTGTRTIDYTHESDDGKTLCLSILDAIVAETSFDVIVETLSGTNLLNLQKDVDVINEDVVVINGDIQDVKDSIEKIKGYKEDSLLFPNGSAAYTLKSMPYTFEDGKKYGVFINYPPNISYQTVLQVRTSDGREISGMSNISTGTTSRYVEFTCNTNFGRLLCLSLRTPATTDASFDIKLVFDDDLSLNSLNEEISNINSRLKYYYTKNDLIQGSYSGIYLTERTDRVSSKLMLVPNTKKIIIECSDSTLRKSYRVQLFTKDKTYITEADFQDYPVYDVSHVEGAYYFRFSQFNDNNGDITPESCDGIFSVALNTDILIGDLHKLDTDNKTCLVDAINEAYGKDSPSISAAKNTLFNTVINDYADFRLLLFTDPHTFDKKHYQLYKKLYDMGFLDCVLGLGDIMPYVDMPIDECVEGITEVMTASGRTKNNLYGVGNHDVGVTLNWEQNQPGCGPINNTHITTKRNQYDFFARHLQDEIHRDPNDPYNVYYYKDFDYAKVRIIMLNASDIYDNNALEYRYTANVAYHQGQIDWLVNTALDLSSKGADITNWHIIVCTHTFNGYGFVRDILTAAHNGTTINSTQTIYTRMKYDSQTENYKPDPEHTEGGITLSVNHTFNTPLNIIAFRGHDHFDYVTEHNGLKVVEFYCDNDELFHPYVTEVAAMPLGHYFFTTHRNHRYGFEVTQLYQDATYVCYNGYFAASSYCEVSVLDSDYNVLQKWNAQELTNDADLTDYTELTDFEDAVKNEADKRYFSVVCLNKVENTIKTFPFSWGGHREISI